MKLTFSEHVNGVFAAMQTNYEAMNNLMQDVALGKEIYDTESDRIISKKEANDKIYQFSLKLLGIENVHDKKQVRRGFRDHGREWFDIIEDTIDARIAWGFANLFLIMYVLNSKKLKRELVDLVVCFFLRNNSV